MFSLPYSAALGPLSGGALVGSCTISLSYCPFPHTILGRALILYFTLYHQPILYPSYTALCLPLISGSFLQLFWCSRERERARARMCISSCGRGTAASECFRTIANEAARTYPEKWFMKRNQSLYTRPVSQYHNRPSLSKRPRKHFYNHLSNKPLWKAKSLTSFTT